MWPEKHTFSPIGARKPVAGHRDMRFFWDPDRGKMRIIGGLLHPGEFFVR
jgi:hypothetical protein